MSHVVSFDIGTSGTKALLIDGTGKIVESAVKEYPISFPKAGWAEQDPRIWWDAVCETSRSLHKSHAREFDDLKAVGLSGQMHGSVFLDASGKVIRPALLWCDARTGPQVEKMASLLPRETVSRILSNPLLAGLTAPKLLWLRDVEPKAYRRLKTLLLPKDYIRFMMTGNLATEVSDASGTLLFDVKNRRWAQEVLDVLDLDAAILPRVGGSAEIGGSVTRSASQELGIPQETPVIHGGGDAVMATVGTGIVEPGRALTVIGTGGNVTIYSETPSVDPEVRLNTFCNVISNSWIQLGVQQFSGNSLRWLRDGLGLFELRIREEEERDAYEILISQAEKVAAGSEGLIFLPYFMGERTPHMDPYARGVFFGLSGNHDRRHFVRAVMEGVVFSFRDTVELVRQMGVPVRTVRATGGGARSPLWVQMQADVFGCPAEILEVDEGSGYGAALMAAVAMGLFDDVAEATEANIRVARIYEPNTRNQRIYDEIFREYQGLYPALKESFASLSRKVGQSK
jgi:xylulokinase